MYLPTPQLPEWPVTLSASVAPGADRAPLPLIHLATVRAAPGILVESGDRVEKVVTQTDGHPIPIHLLHLAAKVRPMIRPALTDIELPLVNHLVGERRDHVAVLLVLQQRGRQPDQTIARASLSMGRPGTADEHP